MESPAVARIYEVAFRPALTRLAGGPSYAREEAFLTAQLDPAEGPILDLACGTGRYTRRLASRYPGRAVIGADLSASMLARAAAEGGALYLRASAQALPFADACLGHVNCFGALHLFPDPPAALAEMGRCLAPGGGLTVLTASRVEGAGRPLQRAFDRAVKLEFISARTSRRGWRPAVCR